MSSPEAKDRAIRSQPQRGLESPFLEEGLFAGEAEDEGGPRLAALEAESPFLSAFEQPWVHISAAEIERAQAFEDERARVSDASDEEEDFEYDEDVLHMEEADGEEQEYTGQYESAFEYDNPEPHVLANSPHATVVSGLRRHIVDRAKEEWEKWRRGTVSETSEQGRNLLRKYWMNYRPKAYSQSQADTKIDEREAWSAIFISYVMRSAGAGDAFTYGTSHTTFIAAAKKAATAHDSSKFQAFKISTVKPEIGDLVCRDRAPKLGDPCAGTDFENVVSGQKSHSDIVVEIHPNYIIVLGGNTGQTYPKGQEGLGKHTVGQRIVRLDQRGFVIPDQNKPKSCKYFAIVKPPSVAGITLLFAALGSLVARFRELIISGQEHLAITLAHKQGITDKNKLTNLVFFTRHPELNGRRIDPSEKHLVREWLDIRNQLVTPMLSIHEIENENILPNTLLERSKEKETEREYYSFKEEEFLDEESLANSEESTEELYDDEEASYNEGEEEDSYSEGTQSPEGEATIPEEAWIELNEEAASLPEESTNKEAEPSLDEEFFIERLLGLLNPGLIVQQVQQLLSNGALSLSLLGRFASGQIWNEDHLALEILFRRKPQLRPTELDKATDSRRLRLLHSLAVKHWRELKSIREHIVRPIFGNPRNFQLRQATRHQIHDLRKEVQKLGPLPAGKNKNGQIYFKKSARNSPRKQKDIDSIVLHHMAFNRGNDVNKYQRVGAHYIIMADGQVAQLYDDIDFLNASNGFNPRSIAIEFAGNFPDHQYSWWRAAKSPIPDRCYLTPAQISAGRWLLERLKTQLPAVRYVYAHRQSSDKSKDNDPGPDVWFNIGEWAVAHLNLTDKLPKTHINNGKPIPSIWRKPRQTTS